MSDLNNIEKLFQEKFENFEMPVRAELWSQVASGAGVGKAVFWTASKMIAAAFVAVMVVSVATWFVVNSGSQTVNHAVVSSEKEQPEDESPAQAEVTTFDTETQTDQDASLVNHVVDDPKTNTHPEKPANQVDILWRIDFEPNREVYFHEEPAQYFIPVDYIENEVVVSESPSQHYEPAPVETLKLELLIAPEKTETKSLEQVHFPQEFVKIFNPNLPGESGQFTVYSEDLGSFKIEIRTRSGKLVYTSTDPNFGWFGEQLDGSQAPEGTYMYTIFSTSMDGAPIKPQSGAVFLMRK